MENDLWIIESGIKRRAEKHTCEYCKKEFLRRKNGKKRFCSNICGYESHKKKVIVICFNCGKRIETTPSKLKNSKHGFHFCGRKCKEESQSLKGNCPDIRPPHYGTSEGRELYKNLIKNTKNPVCNGCGEDTDFLLQVHHIDGNRNNNVEENLEIVCANCHVKRHLKQTNKFWIFSTKNLTPRDVINEF